MSDQEAQGHRLTHNCAKISICDDNTQLCKFVDGALALHAASSGVNNVVVKLLMGDVNALR
jgi:hypothetical protein